MSDPLRSTLLALPWILALFAAIALAARARGARPLPAGWVRGGLAALGALAAAALARAPLGLEAATPALAAGLLGLAAAHAAVQASALRPLLGARVPARPSALFFALPAVLYLALLPWAAERRQPDGDEPYYLLVAHSLAYDFDADLADEYADGDWRYFMDRPIGPQPGDPRGRSGEVYSRHNALLPIVLALPYRLAGKPGALVAMSLLAAAMAWLTLRLAGRYFPDRPDGALLAYGLVALAPPLLCYAHQVWVEVPAAALLALALAAVARPAGAGAEPDAEVREEDRLGVAGWLALAVPLALLPLLKIRFALVALPVLLLAFRRDRSSRRSKRALALVAALLIATLGAVLLWNLLRYGNALKIHRWDELALPAMSARKGVEGLFGLFWDCAFGLFAFAPLWMLTIPALLMAVRRRLPIAGHLAVVALPYLLLLAPRDEWYGGWSPPFRYGVVLLPLLAVLLVPLLAERRRPGARLVLGALGAATVALALLWLAVPGLTYHLADGRTRILDILSAGFGADAARLFPSYVRPRLASWLWPPITAALVAGFWWLGRGPAEAGRAPGRAVRVAGDGAVVAGVALFVAAVAAVPALATRLPIRVVEAEDPWVAHHGGHIHPETWMISRGRFRGGWVIRPGESIEVPLVQAASPGGERLHLRVALRVGRNNSDPIGLEVLAGGEKVAGWAADGGGIWGLVDLGTFDLPDGEPLTIRAAGPPRAGRQNGVLIDRLELSWE